MVQTFTSFADALSQDTKWTQRVVLINGIPTPCTDVSTRHGVTTPVGSCTLMLEAPLPPHVVTGATVEVQAGYPGVMATVFHGFLPEDDAQLDTSGAWATLSARGWADLLSDAPDTTLRWKGPVALKEIVRSIFALCKLPLYLVDDITYSNGADIRIGINRLVNDGEIVISRDTGLLGWLTQTLDLFGYRLFDTPEGIVRVQRVSGAPVGAPVLTVQEGQLPGLGYGRKRTTDGMATYWEVKGATYTDSDGVQQTIRSIPATVPTTPSLPKKGWRKASRSSDVLVNVEMADRARNVLERDYGAVLTPVTWTTECAPHVQPGDVAAVESPTVGAAGTLWITSVAHTSSAGAVTTTTYEGTRGNGEALPAGQDCIALTLRSAAVHLGDEYVPWYAQPNHSGREVRVDFTVPDDYTSLKITALAHGCNSYLLDGENTEATVSKFVIRQNGEDVSSGNLPSLAEDYERRLPYGSGDAHWSRIVVPMPGALKAGTATLVIESGEDTRASGGPWDDFEVKNIVLTACGVGQPLFVGSI